ncbi:FAD-dependent oxidoreductase [Tessaracoccus sp. MC1756]|uniref:FAD-dependent oxidoreductase n=1 Tax=Tessaracoccus sp. MC1756 TaxID=2760311 RepID=UPI001603C45D|nr:FAD-dependent oxidoreductase [Tessaracoccus sp. MC1756]MBB1510548.1 NAD(P)/FAD-dependent oxidoreductase [Tessaracoccus sp. MC1756]
MNVDTVVIGAGQAGLSAAHHLQRLGIHFVVLDANPAPGGAWQHRWDSLTMHDVHGVADLPGTDATAWDGAARANVEVPEYFADYERRFNLPVQRPVRVSRVESDPGTRHLLIRTTRGTWRARSLINATGTWDTPFIPYYPGADTFRGEQFHTARYPGPAALAGKKVVIVGGGASAVQFLGELAGRADLTWVTRRRPVWRSTEFDPDAGREAVALVEERVKRGLPPRSVVSVTGLMLREQEQKAAAMGVYAARRPMFTRIEPDGVRFADGSFQPADVLLWATGFRPSIAHLAPLRLRSPEGGIELLAPRDPHTFTTSAVDGRIHFVGYGPSASTIGATRAGRVAALTIREQLDGVAA